MNNTALDDVIMLLTFVPSATAQYGKKLHILA
jgi:hypothetical protein